MTGSSAFADDDDGQFPASPKNKTGGAFAPPEFVTHGRTTRAPLSARWPPVAPGRRRLVGDAPVITAIGRAGDGLAAAEIEICLTRVADRPVAFVVIEFEQRAALA